jgi:hypothetical protein
MPTTTAIPMATAIPKIPKATVITTAEPTSRNDLLGLS